MRQLWEEWKLYSIGFILMYNTNISSCLLRVLIGVEEPEDIIQDFEQALRKAE